MVPGNSGSSRSTTVTICHADSNVTWMAINGDPLTEEQIRSLRNGEIVQLNSGITIRNGVVAPVVNLARLTDERIRKPRDMSYMNSFLEKKQKRRY